MEKRVVRNSTQILVHVYFRVLLVMFVSVIEGQAGKKLVPAMFIFGDSLIDNGNNNYIPSIARANYFPYGIDFGYPTGRFCNGLTVVDYGAKILGLPLIPPYLSPMAKGSNILNGLNYASAAAGILDDTGGNYAARVSMNAQILMFEKTLRLQMPSMFKSQEDLNDHISKSIFYITMGSNDYINNYLMPNLYPSSHTFTPEAFADHLISTFSTQLSNLYNLGARKMVLVAVPPLGCIPSQLSMVSGDHGCIDSINNLVSLFNSRVLPLTKELTDTLPGATFVFHDVYSVVFDMVKNPSKYGLKVVNHACCGNGRYGGTLTCLPLQQPCLDRDKYLFWDAFHPTQAVNDMVANRSFRSGSSVDCYPISIGQLAKL
ncbi:Lipase [Macleaya cordata]|uniref:Lipase n=1 Tax=Macleaya cordata TaxID=56857 RepID=A0A200QIK4_MACCD|nr:Lipase [Macleaya cordata]